MESFLGALSVLIPFLIVVGGIFYWVIVVRKKRPSIIDRAEDVFDAAERKWNGQNK